MARPIKEGFDYFPMDVNFDKKIKALESVFKNDGFVWIIKFWQEAYQNNTGDVRLDSYHGVIHAENCRITPEKQDEIIKMCLEIGLLIKTGDGSYSSNGIKRRINFLISERKRWRSTQEKTVIHVDNPFSTELSAEIRGESKVKESKVNNKSFIANANTSEELFLEELKKTYDYVDMGLEIKKMDMWLSTRPGRKRTRRFMLNWLSKIEKPMVSKNTNISDYMKK